MALSQYAMVALQRDSKLATEAAMKYFVLGALSSGLLLYGISMLYGATGSLAIPEISTLILNGHANRYFIGICYCVYSSRNRVQIRCGAISYVDTGCV